MGSPSGITQLVPLVLNNGGASPPLELLVELLDELLEELLELELEEVLELVELELEEVLELVELELEEVLELLELELDDEPSPGEPLSPPPQATRRDSVAYKGNTKKRDVFWPFKS